MGRQPCCEKVGLKRGPWTIEEDNKLMDFILNNGIQCWRLVPKLAGLKRCGKSCRLRWINYLRPDLKRGSWTEAEEDMMIQLHSSLGNRWSKIAAHFPGRTDNEIKNHWNTKIKKRLQNLGLDSSTQKPTERDESSYVRNQGLQAYDMPGQPEILKVDVPKSTFLSMNYTKLEVDKALNPSLDEPKNGGTSQNITSEESSVLHDMKECPKMGTEKVHNAEWDCLMGMDHQTLPQEYDPFQNWITSPLAWDLFNSFQDNFL